MAKIKKDRINKFQNDYNSNRFYDLVTIIGAVNKINTKNIESWSCLLNKIENKTVPKSDEDIEKETIEKYNKIYNIN